MCDVYVNNNNEDGNQEETTEYDTNISENESNKTGEFKDKTLLSRYHIHLENAETNAETCDFEEDTDKENVSICSEDRKSEPGSISNSNSETDTKRETEESESDDYDMEETIEINKKGRTFTSQILDKPDDYVTAKPCSKNNPQEFGKEDNASWTIDKADEIGDVARIIPRQFNVSDFNLKWKLEDTFWDEKKKLIKDFNRLKVIDDHALQVRHTNKFNIIYTTKIIESVCLYVCPAMRFVML